MIVVRGGQVALARGALSPACAVAAQEGGNGSGKQGAALTLDSVNRCIAQDCEAIGGSAKQEVLAQSRREIEASDLRGWSCIPQGCEGALLLPLVQLGGGDGIGSFVLVLSEFSEGWTAKDLQWLRIIAEKLDMVLQ